MQEKHQKQHRFIAHFVTLVSINIQKEVLVVFRVSREHFKTKVVLNGANYVKTIRFHGIQQEHLAKYALMVERLKLEVLRVQRAELVEKK